MAARQGGDSENGKLGKVQCGKMEEEENEQEEPVVKDSHWRGSYRIHFFAPLPGATVVGDFEESIGA